jgi:NAD(P)-dependent dehydrogenase (short-subunit alcohol dehydrogenase family)
MAEKKTRIAIVTGATSGIGEATACKFVADGIQVVGCGRRAERLTALERKLGAGFRGMAGDAADSEVLERLFETAVEQFGHGADIVVANAGRGLGGSVKDADLAQFQELMNINVTGTAYLIQKAAQRMVETQKTAFPESAADIVIIGSVVGGTFRPSVPYTAHPSMRFMRWRKACGAMWARRGFAFHWYNRALSSADSRPGLTTAMSWSKASTKNSDRCPAATTLPIPSIMSSRCRPI